MGLLPFSTNKDEPANSKAKSKSKMLTFLPINLLRNAQEAVESVLFYPLDMVGLKVGTKMAVWATKEA